MKIQYKVLNEQFNWQPWNSIFLNKDRILEIVKNEKLDLDMIINQNIIYDVKNQRINSLILNINEYKGELIFYIKFPDCVKEWKYVFAYVEDTTYEVNRVILNLKIDTISSSYLNDINLGGSWYLEQGHIYEKEKNTICGSCSNLNSNEILYLKSNTPINYNFNIMVKKETSTDENKYYKLIKWEKDKLDNLITGYTYKDYGVATTKFSNLISLEKNRSLNYDNISVPVLTYNEFSNIFKYYKDSNKLYPVDIEAMVNEKVKGVYDNFYIEGETRDIAINKNILFKNYLKRMNELQYVKLKEILDFSQSEKIKNIYCLPTIFVNKNSDYIEKFEIDITTIFKNWDFNNHLLKHAKTSVCINNLILFEFSPFKTNKKNIYGSRILNNGNLTYNFYYDETYNDLICKITINNELQIESDAYDNFIKNRENTYYAGYKTQQTDQWINLASSILIGAGSAVLTGGSSIAGAGISLVSGLLNTFISQYQRTKMRELELQDIKNSPTIIRNMPSYDFINSIYDGDISSGKIIECWEGTPDKENNKDLIKRIFIIYNKKQSFNSLNNNITFKINYLNKDDVDLILKEQKLKGNIINTYKDIINPYLKPEKFENKYWYFKGVPQFVSYNYNINILRDILEKYGNGVVFLENENVKWE